MSNSPDYVIQIYNTLGRNVYSKKLNGESNIIDTKGLNSGMYFLYFEGQEKYMFKMLKY